MRIAISLFFLASMVMFLLAQRAMETGISATGSLGINDPEQLAVGMTETVKFTAFFGSLAAVTLILMCISGFKDRAWARGIFTALLALAGTALAVISVFIMLGIMEGGRPGPLEEGYSLSVVTSPITTAHHRGMLMLQVLTLGTAATLMGRRKVVQSG